MQKSTEELVPTTLDAYEPSTTALADGGHLVVWSSPDTDRNGIWAQRYDAAGNEVGAIYQINTDEVLSQDKPEIIAMTDGNLLVTWRTYNPSTGDGEGIFAQKLDATGQAVGAQFEITDATAQNEGYQSIAALPGGKFVVVWASETVGGQADIVGRMFNADGSPAGGVFQASSGVSFTNDYNISAVQSLAGGGFVITWFAASGLWGSDTGGGVFGQRYDAAGMPVGSEFHINSTTNNAEGDPKIIGLDDGGFISVWLSLETAATTPADTLGLYLQRFDAAGATVGDETLLDVDPAALFGGGTANPTLAQAIELQDGGFALLWINGNSDTLNVQSFDTLGNALAPAEVIATNTVTAGGSTFKVDLDQVEDGRLLVTWDDYVNADLYRTFLDKPPASEFGSIGVISGTSGNDIIDGTYLDAEGDAVSAVDDFILAGSGDDTINSAGGNDVIYGGSGDDLLLGGAGNDTMTGDAGIDTLTGGSGADVFVFKPNTGTDTIADFDAAEGDLIQIYGVSGQGEINLVQVGGDTEIRTTAGDVLAVAEGVHLTDFGDFLFG